MVDSSGSADTSRGERPLDELDSDQERWETGIRAILQASDAERRAIDGYLGLMRDIDDESRSTREVDALIDDAIRNHERAIEDLQLAKRTIVEGDTGP